MPQKISTRAAHAHYSHKSEAGRKGIASGVRSALGDAKNVVSKPKLPKILARRKK